MLPKAKRLTTKDFKQFQRTFFVHTPRLTLRCIRVPVGKEKFAVIVSASTYKKAVDRNLLRRRMYHIIAKHPFQPQKTLTVTLKKGALDITFKELEQEVLMAVKQAVRRL